MTRTAVATGDEEPPRRPAVVSVAPTGTTVNSSRWVQITTIQGVTVQQPDPRPRTA